MYDLLITRGQIFAGSGGGALPGNVAIKDGRIVGVGKVEGTAARVLNVDGLAVAPGFIDPHTHYDAQITWDPLATCSSWHGVTTVVMGNCGFGLAPCHPADRDSLLRTLVNVEGMSYEALRAGISWDWETIPEYLARLGQQSLGVNVGLLIAHSAVRQYVLRDDASEREATAAEIAAMREIIRAGLRAGALGFATSASLTHVGDRGKPVPSRLASLEEIVALAAVQGEEGHGITELTIGPKTGYDFLARLVRESGRPLTWAALLDRSDRPGYWRKLLARTQALREEGVAIYPQVSCRPATLQFDLRAPFAFESFPSWTRAANRSVAERITVYQDPGFRDAFRQEMRPEAKPALFAGQWDRVTVLAVTRNIHRSFVGRTIADIAAERGEDPVDTFLDLAIAENLEMRFRLELMNTDPVAVGELITHPLGLIALSDAGAHATQFCDAGYATYLLGHWVREKGVMPLAEAVLRLTAMPAEVYGITDRGRIAPGLAADLVIFDPQTVGAREADPVTDLPGGEPRLVQRAEGIHYTIVNGEILFDHGLHQGTYPGRVVRGGNH